MRDAPALLPLRIILKDIQVDKAISYAELVRQVGAASAQGERLLSTALEQSPAGGWLALDDEQANAVHAALDQANETVKLALRALGGNGEDPKAAFLDRAYNVLEYSVATICLRQASEPASAHAGRARSARSQLAALAERAQAYLANLNSDGLIPPPYSCGAVPRVGDRVRVADQHLSVFNKQTQARVQGRDGIVTGFTYPNAHPLITFAAAGRKSEYVMGQCGALWLFLVDRAESTGKD